jgi:ACS family sodium-dependent inorganic phosphate cotransporter
MSAQNDDDVIVEEQISDTTKLLSGLEMPPVEQQSRRRLIVSLFLFVSNLICYADRTNMSVCIIPMALDFNWDEMTQASVLSSFFWGYMSTQLVSGLLCKRYGGKNILLAGVLIWSVFTLLTPVAAAWASGRWLLVLYAVRVGMGLGEGSFIYLVLTL